MNFSPLNDPSFEEHRKREAEKAAKRRRKKTLIVLVSVSLLLLAATSLLVFAGIDYFSGQGKTPPEQNTAQTAVPTPTKDGQTTVPPAPTEEPTRQETGKTPETELSPQPVTSEPPSETESKHEPIIRTTTVILDAGHGFLNAAGDAMDKGAGKAEYPYYQLSVEQTGSPMYESDLVLILAKKVKALLEEKEYTVIMSREDYVYKSFSVNQRAKWVRETDADLLVSIHANSTDDASVCGARVFYNDNSELDMFVERKTFATAVASKIDAYGASLRKTLISSGKNLAMLRDTGELPAVLVETCFLTNKDDSALALTEEWQDNMAKAIAEAVMERYPLKKTIL